jgi:glutamate formiminotransferase/formiminotetrahydrofolate cyclodeaminase
VSITGIDALQFGRRPFFLLDLHSGYWRSAVFWGGIELTNLGFSDSLWSWSLADFRERTAAGSPTPGGGAVAAVCASLGVGLVVMGLEVTLRGGTPETVARLTPLLRTGRELLERQSAYADRDLVVFGEYMRARSLPQGSDAEKAARRDRLQRALIGATEVPLAAGRDIAAAIELSRQVVEICKPQVFGDVAAGADLLAGSLTAVLRSVDANLRGLAEGPLKKGLQEEWTALVESAAQIVAATQAAVEGRRQGL